MVNTFLIKKIGLTEKATTMEKHGKYVFMVKLSASKPEIRKAIEELYRVKVADVNTVISYSKAKRYGYKIGKKPKYKKAVVTLKAGEKIDTASTK